jgi:radical SAM superfamily enzyme YgiQ (UPF0313 family)
MIEHCENSENALEKIKIAFISLAQEEFERCPPIGLVYITTYLRDRAGLNPNNLRIIDLNYMNLEEELEKFCPNIICFSAMTVDYGKVSKLAQKMRKKYQIPFILGGVHISTLPSSLCKSFDIGVLGEGELTLAEIIKVYSKNMSLSERELKKIKGIVFFWNNKLILNTPREPIKELDSLPIPDFKLVNRDYFKESEIPAVSSIGIKCYLITSRGCPYRCLFCSTSRFWGRMRFHSADYTARIVKKAIEDFGATHVRVMDDLFSVSVQRVREVKEAFENYGLLNKIKTIECQPRANLMTDELCKALKEIKVKTLNFGFESGSERMLQWLKQESVTVEMNRKAILMCNKYGFNVYGSLMYGSPSETLEDMQKTNEFIDFALKHHAKHIWSFISTPFPATPFWDVALKRGKVKNDMDWNLLSHQNIDDPLLLDESIDKEEFKKVFLEGRKKLRRMNIGLIRDLVLNSPFGVIRLFVKDPVYYLSRISSQVFKQ